MERGAETRVVLVPFPSQGHVTPTLQLARVLHALGFLVTLATPDSIHHRLVSGASAPDGARLRFASISSGVDADDDDGRKDVADVIKIMGARLKEGLRSLLLRLSVDEGATSLMVIDLLAAPWAMPVAAEFGIPVAGFWTATLAAYRIFATMPELRRRGLISEREGIPFVHQLPDRQPQGKDQGQVLREIMKFAGQDNLSIKQLPWFTRSSAPQEKCFAFWLGVVEHAKALRWLLVNSFAGEGGGEPVRQPSDSEDTPRIFQVGPLLACNISDDGGTDHRLPSPGRNISLLEEDCGCLEWLQRHPPKSVIYVSFGSWVNPVAAEKIMIIRELALGLEATGRPFLWALKKDAEWRAGLPDGYLDRIQGRGKVVSWAPQEEVLRHEATGCYLTHCGWNSTLEAIQHGKRLLCYPITSDQFVNCAYIVDVWGVGATPEGRDRNAIHKAIEEIMAGDEGEMMQRRMTELKKQVMGHQAIAKAVANLQCFIDQVPFISK